MTEALRVQCGAGHSAGSLSAHHQQRSRLRRASCSQSTWDAPHRRQRMDAQRAWRWRYILHLKEAWHASLAPPTALPAAAAGGSPLLAAAAFAAASTRPTAQLHQVRGVSASKSAGEPQQLVRANRRLRTAALPVTAEHFWTGWFRTSAISASRITSAATLRGWPERPCCFEAGPAPQAWRRSWPFSGRAQLPLNIRNTAQPCCLSGLGGLATGTEPRHWRAQSVERGEA